MDERQILLHHKRWADFWTSVSIVVTVGLFIAITFLMDDIGASAGERIGTYACLATVITVGIIWQAAGLALGRLEISLERRRG